MSVVEAQQSFHPLTYIQEIYEGTCTNVSNFIESQREPFSQTVEKIQEMALPVLQFSVGTILFLTNSSLFVLGAVAGAVFPEPLNSAIERINGIWQGQSMFFKATVITGVVIAWPISLALSSFFIGAYSSIYLQQQLEQKEKPDTQTS